MIPLVVEALRNTDRFFGTDRYAELTGLAQALIDLYLSFCCHIFVMYTFFGMARY
jgi:hypothetical protein